MGVWLNGGPGGFINLSLITHAEIYPIPAVPAGGNVRFYFQDGTYTQVVMGSNDAAAATAMVRLLDAVNPSSYS